MKNGPRQSSTKKSIVPQVVRNGPNTHVIIDTNPPMNRPVGQSRSISTVRSITPTGEHGRYRRSVRLHPGLWRITVDRRSSINDRDNFVIDWTDDDTCGILPITADPTWGDIFECSFKAQSPKLERRASSFELSEMSPQVGSAVLQPIPLGVSFSKAQSSKLERLFCHVSVKRDVWALSFELETAFENVTPSGIGCMLLGTHLEELEIKWELARILTARLCVCSSSPFLDPWGASTWDLGVFRICQKICSFCWG